MDRDFHTKTEIQAVKRYAKKLGVNLHIWSRKEIENYLLIPSAIERIINRLLAAGEKRVKEIDVENQMFDFADKLKEHVIDKMADAVYFASKDKGKGVSWARNKVKPQVEKNWKDPGKVVEMVPGKKLIRMMSGWSQKKFKVAFGAAGIAREIRSNEIPEEMAEVLSSIEAKRPL